MTDVFAIYERLWQRAEGLGCRVWYDGFLRDGEGRFHEDPNGDGSLPRITIGRPYYEQIDRPARSRNAAGREKLPQPDILQEGITLAHEFGHFLSWKERTPRAEWENYLLAATARDEAWEAVSRDGTNNDYDARLRAAVTKALSPENIQRIVAEEERAWTIGREALEDLGFENFEEYAERTRRGLHYHRYRLGLDELWPEEVGRTPDGSGEPAQPGIEPEGPSLAD